MTVDRFCALVDRRKIKVFSPESVFFFNETLTELKKKRLHLIKINLRGLLKDYCYEIF